MDYHSADSDCGELFLTQTKTCEKRSNEEWTDHYLHPEITTFDENKSSDDELCELAIRTDKGFKATYSDISSASEGESAYYQCMTGVATKEDNGRFKPPKSDTEMDRYGIRSGGRVAGIRRYCNGESKSARLYKAEIDEQLISETTGHRRLAVREYKRTSDDLRVHMNSIINGSVGAGGDAEDGPPDKCCRSPNKTTVSPDSVSTTESNISNITVNINISK